MNNTFDDDDRMFSGVPFDSKAAALVDELFESSTGSSMNDTEFSVKHQQSLMAEARARIPTHDQFTGSAPQPQGYRPDLPRPPRNAQATSNYRCAVKLLECIESKLNVETKTSTSSTSEILENIALVKHQLDNLLGEINQLHQSAEDSSYANKQAWAISRLRERDLGHENRRLTEEVKSITKSRDEMAKFAASNSKKIRESTARIQKLEALLVVADGGLAQAQRQLQELPQSQWSATGYANNRD